MMSILVYLEDKHIIEFKVFNLNIMFTLSPGQNSSHSDSAASACCCLAGSGA